MPDNKPIPADVMKRAQEIWYDLERAGRRVEEELVIAQALQEAEQRGYLKSMEYSLEFAENNKRIDVPCWWIKGVIEALIKAEKKVTG